jgi:hypothetical protein
VKRTPFPQHLTLCLAIVVGLTSFVQAQPVALRTVRFAQDDSFRDNPTNAVSFELPLPAAFPRPARTAFVKLECNNDAMQVTGSDLDDFTATLNATLTPTALSFGAFKASCLAGQLSVSHPQLLNWLVPTIDDLSDLGDATQYGPDSKGFAVTADRLNFAVAVGAVENTAFQRVGQTLKVVANGSDVAVSLTQGGKKAQPLALGDQRLGPLTLNAQQPFTLHLSRDNGEHWQNVTVNLAQPSLTFWTSAQPGGPAYPPSDY